MTTMDDAFKAIEGYYDEETKEVVPGAIETLLKPMVDDDTITEVIIGEKTRGTPKPPFINVISDVAKLEQTTSLGGTESWTIPLKIKAVIKESKYPTRGRSKARSIISEARTLLLASRQLSIPSIVRKVDSYQIIVVPYPFALNSKKNAIREYYGAGTILNVLIIINNKE